MASPTGDVNNDFDQMARDSGIPPKGRIGASRNELLALALGVVAFLLIAVAFWWQATR